MSVSVGDVVQFAGHGPKADIGRVCKDNGITVCVHFKSGGCLRVAKAALEVNPTAKGAPEVSEECASGC